MKKLCLPLAFLTAGCAEITDMYVPVHISANTNADIYVGSKMAGTTPAIVYLRPDNLKADHIILKKKGFEDAKIAIDPVFKQRKTTATTWSDKRIGGYLETKYDVHLQNVCFARGGFDPIFGFSTCAGTSFPAAFATALPASVSRYAAPYTVVEYEPRQYFVTMRPNGEPTVDPLSVQSRDLILKYYPTAYSSEEESFSKFIAKTTGISENYLYWRMFDEHRTPDGAADAVAKDIERFNEIRSVLKKDLSVNKTVAALNKITGVPEKALRYAVSADKDKAAERILMLWRVVRLKDCCDIPPDIRPRDFATAEEIRLIRNFTLVKCIGIWKRFARSGSTDTIDFLHEMTLISPDGLRNVIFNAQTAGEAADNIARLAAFSGRVADIVSKRGNVNWNKIKSETGLTDEEIRHLRALKKNKKELIPLIVQKSEDRIIDRLLQAQ